MFIGLVSLCVTVRAHKDTDGNMLSCHHKIGDSYSQCHTGVLQQREKLQQSVQVQCTWSLSLCSKLRRGDRLSRSD
jgi:hypothetical protein